MIPRPLTEMGTMYEEWFCGLKGRRTIFTIEGVFCIFIKAFSEIPQEAEVLFPPSARFKVSAVNARLRPYALQSKIQSFKIFRNLTLIFVPFLVEISVGRSRYDLTHPYPAPDAHDSRGFPDEVTLRGPMEEAVPDGMTLGADRAIIDHRS